MKKSNDIHTFIILAYKESKYLEECIKSVLNQSIKTNVVIATSTQNKYIDLLAKKYKLKVIVNNSKEKGIGNDFNFAVHSVNTELVTVAHQDDIYDYNYAQEVLNNYEKYNNSIVLFTNYYEIRNNKSVYSNKNLNIKKILLISLKIKKLSHFKFLKRNVLRFGNAICCPAVTFVSKKMPKTIFKNKFTCNIDWEAWEMLSKIKGNFIYISKPLMGHRVHEESTTTEIIHDNVRTKEDFEMFRKFWPNFIAKTINTFYKKSEDNNKI